jgi:two-component system sensor kinase FixL
LLIVNPIVTRGVSLDITERKQAEQETHLLRQEIAQVGRVSMIGKLASVLAHEINQPLGAILRHAEAAEIFLLSGIGLIFSWVGNSSKACRPPW